MNEIFSTREMARLCGVNESTIKRWADSGRLKCLKTPGGHRKFRIRDVLAFLNEYGFEGLGLEGATPLPDGENALAVRILRRDWDGLARYYLDTGMNGTAQAVVGYLFQLVTGGCSLVDICDRVIAPALTTLGDRWEAGNASVFDEHVVSAATIHGLERLRDTLPQQVGHGWSVFCAPIDGEAHEIGTRMAGLLLDRLGWDVTLAVDGLPMPEIVTFVRRERPKLVCLSMITRPDNDGFADTARLLWQATRETGTRLAIGGRGAQGVANLSCDLAADSLAALETYAGQLTARRSPRGDGPHA
jgi:excisionase family DNA binding protein